MISRGRVPTRGLVSKKGHLPKNKKNKTNKNFKRKRGLTLNKVQMIELGSWVSEQFCL